MKDSLRQLIADRDGALPKRCLVREYLQARALQSLQESHAFLCWVFHGGTALRFLHALPRFSEDLDFSLLPEPASVGFRPTLEAARAVFEAENYAVDVKINDRKMVHSAFLRFRGLPHDLGLSPHESETLSIRVELDTNPPRGADFETTLTRRHVTLNLVHHDKASLLAGKLHAVLARTYTKGRDLYDLIWFLADRSWPEPNLPFLNAALRQTEWDGPELTPENWRPVVAGAAERTDWKRAAEDVRPFLERGADLDLLTRENCLTLLRP